jgi:hypothetical protein
MHPDAAPYTRLWNAVLSAAVADAVQHGDDFAQTQTGIVRSSLSWFDTKDAAEICALAGHGRDSIREGVHARRAEYLASGKSFRRFWRVTEAAE